MFDKLQFSMQHDRPIIRCDVERLSDHELAQLRLNLPTLVEQCWMLRREVSDEFHRRQTSDRKRFDDYVPVDCNTQSR